MKNNDKNILLSLDVGTQSVRALAFSPDGNLIDYCRVLYKPAYKSAHPGWAEQDPEYYWESLVQACQGLWEQGKVSPDLVVGVSLTAQRGTVVNLDSDGKPLRPSIIWLDQRRAEKLPKFNFLWRTIFLLTGLKSSISHFQAEAEINWIKGYQPDIWEKTAHYLLLTGYIHYKLTGLFKDSVACQVGYLPFDYKKQQWEKAGHWKWDLFSVRQETLPELVKPGAQLGVITEKASTITGIPINTPVIAAASDKACEIIGAGCLDLHQGCIGYGTTATINVNSNKYFEPLPLAPAYPSAKPGAFNPEVQIFRGFWMVTWFKEQFAQIEQELSNKTGVAAEQILEERAATVPAGSLGLTLQPYWTPGVRFPGLEAKGSIIGFGADHKKEHMYRSILEGLAYGLRDGKEKIEKKSGTAIKELYICGGGSQSDLAMQITADVFGIKTIRPKVTETSGLGAAILTSIGCKIYPDVEAAVEHMTQTGEVFEPDPKSVTIYNALYRNVYKKMYTRLKPLFLSIRHITGYPKRPGE